MIYSPLHGVGATAVCPVLAADGFNDVEVFGPHAKPDGDFPNVPGHVANPENPQVFDAIIVRAQKPAPIWRWRPIPIATASAAPAPLTFDDRARRGTRSPAISSAHCWPITCWRTPQGRGPAHAAAFHRQDAGHDAAGPPHRRQLRRANDRRPAGRLQMDRRGDRRDAGRTCFVFGTEESHGYMAGSYVRDKDGAVASLLLCELAAKLKAAGKTLHEKLDALFWQHGVHAERTVSVQMPGSEGMARMQEVMAAFRAEPPQSSAACAVEQIRDYRAADGHARAGGKPQPLDGPEGRPRVSRSGDRRQLRRLPPQRHRAENQVLHVHLHAAGAAGESRSGQSRARRAARSRWKPICASSPGCSRMRIHDRPSAEVAETAYQILASRALDDIR